MECDGSANTFLDDKPRHPRHAQNKHHMQTEGSGPIYEQLASGDGLVAIFDPSDWVTFERISYVVYLLHSLHRKDVARVLRNSHIGKSIDPSAGKKGEWRIYAPESC